MAQKFDTIHTGDTVRSYDSEYRDNCYAQGVVEDILNEDQLAAMGAPHLASCPRYKIRITKRVVDDKVVSLSDIIRETGDGYVYPPINGIPIWGNKDNVTHRVVLHTDRQPWEV